jgi:hypothetical protein
VAAGVLGAALGPAAGGVLTELIAWESIFLVQVPVALATAVAVRGVRSEPLAARSGWPQIPANAALLLLSGGLVGALFLLVLLLVAGWGMSPAAAGVAVTVTPAAALLASRLERRSTGVGVASGVVLVAGGLAALAFLPRAGWVWTVAPQILLGAGLGIAIPALTEAALRNRPDRVLHGGWTIASRHAGVVVGLVLLAPVLTDALERNQEEATRAGVAVVLDSRVGAFDKLGIARDVLEEVEDAKSRGDLPRVEPVFEDRDDDEEHRDLATALQDQLDRAVTAAFARPFLLGVALALAALVPAVLVGRRELA